MFLEKSVLLVIVYLFCLSLRLFCCMLIVYVVYMFLCFQSMKHRSAPKEKCPGGPEVDACGKAKAYSRVLLSTDKRGEGTVD